MTRIRAHRWMTAVALGAALLAAYGVPAAAGERSKTDERAPATEREKEAAPTSNAPRANARREPTTKPVTLYGNAWYRGTRAAIAAGTSRKRPILLVRMLGELDEKT